MSARITFVPAADVFKGAVFALAGDTGSYFSPLPKHTFANSMLLTPSGFVWWCQLCEVLGSPFKWRSFILGKFGVAGWWVGGGQGWVAAVLFIYLFVVFLLRANVFRPLILKRVPSISPPHRRGLCRKTDLPPSLSVSPQTAPPPPRRPTRTHFTHLQAHAPPSYVLFKNRIAPLSVYLITLQVVSTPLF